MSGAGHEEISLSCFAVPYQDPTQLQRQFQPGDYLFNDMAEIRVFVPFRSASGDGSMGPDIILGISIKHSTATGSSARRLGGTQIFAATDFFGLGTDELIAIGLRTVFRLTRTIPDHRQGRIFRTSRDTVRVDAGNTEVTGVPVIDFNNGQDLPFGKKIIVIKNRVKPGIGS
jgi:hypothetical protein